MLRSDYGFTQALAGAPQLVRRWQDAEFAAPYAHAVITAAVDARRMGVQRPLTAELLRHASAGYLTSAQRATAPADWLERALEYATQRLLGAVSVFEPADAGIGVIAGYTVADYLVLHGSRTRRGSHPPTTAWAAYHAHLANGPDLREVGRAARALGLHQQAADLFHKAVSAHDDPGARSDLFRALWDHGARDLANEYLTQWAATADGYTRLETARLLQDAGRYDEAEALLRAAMAAGEDDARMELAEMLQYRQPEQAIDLYRQALAEGEEEARGPLALLLDQTGQDDQALTVLRDSVNADEQAQANAVMWLSNRGSTDEALEIARKLAQSGHYLGWLQFAMLMSGQGRTQDAVSTLRQAVERGHVHAREPLARLLGDVGQVDEAVALYRAVAEDGTHPDAWQGVANELAAADRADEAISILREAVSHGHNDAVDALGHLLEDECRDAETEQVWRDALAAGDTGARMALGLLLLDFDHNNDSRLEPDLISLDRADEVIDLWREGIQEGDTYPIPWLARLLQLCGRSEEAEELWPDITAEEDS